MSSENRLTELRLKVYGALMAKAYGSVSPEARLTAHNEAFRVIAKKLQDGNSPEEISQAIESTEELAKQRLPNSDTSGTIDES